MSLKNETIKGTIWSSIEKISFLGIQFILQIVLARLLTPKDYGIIGILAVFIAVSNTFIDSGFTSALIQKKDRTEVDFSTAFYFNLVISMICYSILYFSAPYIAKFYQLPILTSITRVLSVSLIFMAISAVNRTKLQIKLDFKTQAKASLTSAILSGIIGIYLAYKGFGVWALVAQQVSNSLFNMLFMFVLIRWKPLFVFSFTSFRKMFSYGMNLMFSNLLDNIYINFRPLIIGKFFSASTLGLYSRAYQFASFPVNMSNSIFVRVAFPLFSKVQDDLTKLLNIYRKFLKIIFGIYIPIIFCLFLVSRPFIIVFLGNKWSGSIVLLRILSLAFMFSCFTNINASLLLSKGYSNIVLKLNLIRKAIAISIFFIMLPFGLNAICWGIFIYGLISLFLGMFFVNKNFNLNYKIQIFDILPIYIVSIICTIISYLMFMSIISNILQLILLTVSFGTLYLSISWFFKFDFLTEGINLLNKKLLNK
ncbi:lipopolysaccharide biosynthesis protein [Candidatus Ruminimicrobium bovinum]|uniref:lipopolysaccharide biosynthesis protein n=1 Tax=Candidatus Ruminimicrobium bovinum TaxID=3242779 RepID=UPI0039B87C07